MKSKKLDKEDSKTNSKFTPQDLEILAKLVKDKQKKKDITKAQAQQPTVYHR